MKLRNKKTGEIKTAYVQVIVENNHPAKPLKYDTQLSLAELNEEWEDYEEPKKEIWWLDSEGHVYNTGRVDEYCFERNKEIGNFFETKEEAEKALEKLKAWKRLKDKGFKFNCRYKPNYGEDFVVGCRLPKETLVVDVAEDLDLLFGGEE